MKEKTKGDKVMTQETAKLLIAVIGCSCVGVGFIVMCAMLAYWEYKEWRKHHHDDN